MDSSLIPQSTLPQITEVIGLSFTWTEYKKLNQMKKAKVDGRAMLKLYTDVLNLSSNRRKWFEDPTKNQFEKELQNNIHFVMEVCLKNKLREIVYSEAHELRDVKSDAGGDDDEEEKESAPLRRKDTVGLESGGEDKKSKGYTRQNTIAEASARAAEREKARLVRNLVIVFGPLCSELGCAPRRFSSFRGFDQILRERPKFGNLIANMYPDTKSEARLIAVCS